MASRIFTSLAYSLVPFFFLGFLTGLAEGTLAGAFFSPESAHPGRLEEALNSMGRDLKGILAQVSPTVPET